MSRRRSPPSAPPLDDEDLLREILLRLPLQPSFLARASSVCTRWRGILSDPQFRKRFRRHHGKPLLLGFFAGPVSREHIFTPVLDSPDRIPAARFSLTMPQSRGPFDRWDLVGCRHGLAVLINKCREEVVVSDPLTGRQQRVRFPRGHVHGDCLSSPFKLFLIRNGDMRTLGSLYDSVSGVWGNIFSATTNSICSIRSSIFAGNALCWLISGGAVLVFDLEMQNLSVIEKPAENHVVANSCFQLVRMEDGGLGLAVLSKLTIQLWVRNTNHDGVVGWVLLQKTIPLDGMFKRRMCSDQKGALFVGYDEDTNVIVLTTMIGNFMLQLDSMQLKHIIKRNDICFDTFYPYTNFYTAGRRIAGGDGGAENANT
ncbi:hypothetical protein CFC21_089646 [Triticum aestivum]|uniref:F-box domain-containing protein n=3 Tax=Triticum TaxID=4564 RepID=A0A9R1BEQ3_TRITD|nr:uncharacterized protein LOC123134757 [Triticum aestivum]KAF7086352.1 hypothetical protein CFC21_089646 [Triticum aestivum]VAI61859.1 unnamed protein product [Triticum turgidum subsp. durum]